MQIHEPQIHDSNSRSSDTRTALSKCKTRWSQWVTQTYDMTHFQSHTYSYDFTDLKYANTPLDVQDRIVSGDVWHDSETQMCDMTHFQSHTHPYDLTNLRYADTPLEVQETG